MKPSIKKYSLEELSSLMGEMGEPPYRAGQIAQWLYLHHARDFDEMTNIPARLRTRLHDEFSLPVPAIINKQTSRDETRKYVLSYDDDACVETVAIPSSSTSSTNSHKRLTVCFSTQSGCPMGCLFCATGNEGFTRSLSPGEMADQVLMAQDDMAQRVTNAVAMGQGEPFLNYESTLAALRIMNSPKYLNIGARHITVSTCGILSGIERLSQEPEQFTLAVSLHAARQHVRDSLMPGVAHQPLDKLKAALLHYVESTGRRVTLEYIMIESVNDSSEDLAALLRFCSGLLCHINILPMNAVTSSPYHASKKATMQRWVNELEKKKIETTVRVSKGSDIAGACGQLKNAL